MVTMIRHSTSLLAAHGLMVVLGICGVAVFILQSCGSPSAGSLDAALAEYKQNNLEEAATLLEGIVDTHPENAEAFVWLAETYRRLDEKSDAVKAARRALELKPCDSFAHSILADTYNPTYGSWEGESTDSVWTHLQAAIDCDPSSPYPWPMMWGEAMRHGNSELVQRAARKMRETEFITPAALEYARWMLHGLPEGSILVTNGDMDTYPVAALQETEELRTDVALVNRSLLNTVWYARYVRDELGVPIPFSDSELANLRPYRDDDGTILTTSTQIIRRWFTEAKLGNFPRPLAFAVTVSIREIGVAEDHLLYAGSHFVWHSERVEQRPDESVISEGLNAIKMSELSGPVASPNDWSPIRLLHSDQIVRNISEAAIRLAGLYIDDGRTEKAEEMLDWATKFENQTELGPVSQDEISAMRERIE